MVTGTRDDGCTVEFTIGPFVYERLIVEILSPFHPVTYLCNEVDVGYACGEGVIVGFGESVMDVAPNQNSWTDRFAVRTQSTDRITDERTGEGVVLILVGPEGFFGHTEPCLPADDADDCTDHQQDTDQYIFG